MAAAKLITKVILVVVLIAPFAVWAGSGKSNNSSFSTDSNRDTAQLTAIQKKITDLIGPYPDSALALAKKQLELATQLNQKNHIANAYYNIAYSYENKNDFDQGIEYYQKSLEVWKELKNQKEQASCITNIGILYEYKSNLPKALEHYLQALSINEKIDDKRAIGYSNNDIGIIYMYLDNHEKAMEYFFKALKILESINYKKGLSLSYMNIGTEYSRQKKYKESEVYFLKALKVRKELGDKPGIAGTYNNLASIYANQNIMDKCLVYFQEYLKVSLELNDKKSVGMAYVNIAILFHKQGEYKKTLIYCDSALKVDEEIGNIWNERIVYEYVSKANSELGRYKEAYEAHVKFKNLTDSIYNAENSKQIGDLKTTYEVEKKEAELKSKHEKIEAIAAEEAKKQRVILFAVGGFALFGLVLTIVIFRSLRINKRKNKIISIQKLLVEEKHREITDSINYAERIQKSFLATSDLLDANLKDYFVFFKPKDVVSGDFYWASTLNNGHFALVVADSTGHGVPGAIMSLLNIMSLEKAVEDLVNPSDILNHTRNTIIQRLKKDGSKEGGKDGMDCSFISFDLANHKLTYAAANNPIWIVREKELIELKPDKMPVGKHDKDSVPFTEHEVELKQGDHVYAITDGMPDQFGGPDGKKYKYKQLKELLIAVSVLPIADQQQALLNSLNAWKGNLEQIDDITILGIKI